jgi:hypothetical protein
MGHLIEQDLADELGWDVEDLFDANDDHNHDDDDDDEDDHVDEDDDGDEDSDDDKETARGLQAMIGTVR